MPPTKSPLAVPPTHASGPRPGWAARPLAGGALIGAGIYALPLLVGALMYVCGGLVFGLGFRRILAKRHTVVAPGGMIESREGALPK